MKLPKFLIQFSYRQSCIFTDFRTSWINVIIIKKINAYITLKEDAEVVILTICRSDIDTLDIGLMIWE